MRAASLWIPSTTKTDSHIYLTRPLVIYKSRKKKRKIVPDGLRLFPYQREGVKRLIQTPRILLADVPGLGKTPQAICLYNALRSTHLLVICPASVCYTWKYEFDRWNTEGKTARVIKNGKEEIHPDDKVIIISYGLAIKTEWVRALQKYLKQSEHTMLFADEAHELRNWSAKRTQTVIIELGRLINRVVLITGTPMMRAAVDLHPLVTSCQPRFLGGTWGKLEDFGYRYCYALSTPYGCGVEYRGIRRVTELRKRMRPIMVRRYKEDVQKDLPPKVYGKVLLDIGKKPKTLPDSTVSQIIARIDEGHEVSLKDNYSTLRKELGVLKLKAALEWFDTFMEANPNEPLVIFGIHKVVCKFLLEYFKNKGRNVTSITGETSITKRHEAQQGFQNGKYQYIVGNVKAMGVGITLHRARYCIFIELDWTPVLMSQAVDRLHRIGQKNTVNVLMMLALGTIDLDICDVIQMKMKENDKVLGKRVRA